MKKIIILALLVCSAIAVRAQTNVTQVPDLMSASTNVPTVQGGFNEILAAAKAGITNSYWVPYGLYAKGLKNKYGGGLGWFLPINTYVVTGLRVDYIDGDFWMPSGNATLQLPLTVLNGVNVTPFAYAGVGVPISGATITTSLGTVNIPGTVRDNNGQPTAILGTGASIRIYSASDNSWSISAVGDIEEWTGFSGQQYRLGIAYHSNKPGLFGLGLTLGNVKL